MNDYNVRNLIYSEVPELKRNIRDLQEKVSNLQINNTALAERIFALEEKERQRAREDYDREILNNWDPDAEGKGRCSICKTFYSYDVLYVVDTVPSDDHHDITEVYVCFDCKKEGSE